MTRRRSVGLPLRQALGQPANGDEFGLGAALCGGGDEGGHTGCLHRSHKPSPSANIRTDAHAKALGALGSSLPLKLPADSPAVQFGPDYTECRVLNDRTVVTLR